MAGAQRGVVEEEWKLSASCVITLQFGGNSLYLYGYEKCCRKTIREMGWRKDATFGRDQAIASR